MRSPGKINSTIGIKIPACTKNRIWTDKNCCDQHFNRAREEAEKNSLRRLVDERPGCVRKRGGPECGASNRWKGNIEDAAEVGC